MGSLLNINTDAVVVYTNRLEKLHKSDLPIAIRNALSKAAFETKTRSLLSISNKTFTNRNRTFFKAKSKFQRALGFDISKMKATVGMVDIRRNGNDHAVRNLEQQERGGKIRGKSFIPTDKARVGGKEVAPRNRISRIPIRDIIRTRKSEGKNKDQRFIRSAIIAKRKFGTRAYILTNRILFRINSLSFGKRTRKLRLKITPLYSFKRGRSVNVTATNFMKRSSLVQAKRLDIFYINEAKKRIAKSKL